MDSGSGSQPPISGMILVALVLGAVFFIEPPLEGSRPKEPARTSDLSSSEQVIPARLWQDPFEAIVLNRTFEKSANGQADKAPPTAAEQPASSQCSSDLGKIFLHSEKNKGFGALLVMTPGSPYVEDGERRIRARYAVVSALGVAGLSPRDSQHVGCSRLAIGGKGDFDMPFEWFDPPDNSAPAEQHSVLIAWLPEEKFSRTPLKALNNLVDQLRLAACREVSVAVVGPHKSGTFSAMRKELLKPDPDFPAMSDVRFYSPSATMDERLLLSETDCPQGETNKGGTKKKVCKSFSELYTGPVYDEAMGDGFIRTILSDSEVSKALTDELELRGLEFDPSRRNWVKISWLWLTERLFQNAGDEGIRTRDASSCGIFDRHRDHVVLITELDTLYGRSFPQAFIQAASSHDAHHQSANSKNSESASDVDELQWIHRFSYLRGLDGQFPAKMRDGTASAPSPGKTSSRQPGKEIQSKIKRAASTPRFDYLRRLAYRVERLDDELRKHYCGSIKAIGVLGSDVYDKLLILQALRERFPNTLFFTADMDARYLHPAEFNWTRNLIVGSSHGLEPDLAFGANIPPFRDSYQTSRFLATLLALSNARKNKQEIESVFVPRVYEIGRTAARELTVAHNLPGKEKRDSVDSRQTDLVIADLFQKSEQQGSGHRLPDSNGGDSEFAAAESYPSFLQVHPVPAKHRFDHLLRDHYPGHFNVAGRVLAAVLAVLGIGYYARSYFGLHPVISMRRNWGSLMSRKPGKTTDGHLVGMTVMLWATLLLVGLSNLTAFLLLGVLIIFMILIGRVSSTVRNGVLKYLQTRRLPAEVAFGLLVAALFWAVYLVIQKGWSPFILAGGEPFSLRDGISMWPGEGVRILAGIVSIGYMVAGWRSLKEGDQLLTEEFFPSVKHKNIEQSEKCARARRVDWCSGHGEDKDKDKDSQNDGCTGPFDAKTNWKHYRFYRTLSERWNSVFFPAALFFLLGCVSIYWLDDFHVPYRGEFIYRFDYVVVFGFMVPAFLLLLFAVIDETTLCVGWVRRLTREFTYKTETSYFLSHTYGEKDDRSETDRDLEEIWTRLQVMARRTRRVGKLIIGPFVALFLILVSQSPYFDNWDIPSGLIVMILLSAAYATLCAIKLRRVSEVARREAIAELTQQLIRRGGKDDKIQFLLAEVRQIEDGGFLPWTRQPLLKAMFWLISALGIMSAEYISIGAMR